MENAKPDVPCGDEKQHWLREKLVDPFWPRARGLVEAQRLVLLALVLTERRVGLCKARKSVHSAKAVADETVKCSAHAGKKN